MAHDASRAFYSAAKLHTWLPPSIKALQRYFNSRLRDRVNAGHADGHVVDQVLHMGVGAGRFPEAVSNSAERRAGRHGGEEERRLVEPRASEFSSGPIATCARVGGAPGEPVLRKGRVGRGIGELCGDHLYVTGDTLLDDAWQAFDRHGLEPAACPPVITQQTVAGALATGTHAQGLTGGTFSDAVAAIELMDGTGVMQWMPHALPPG